MCMQETDDSAAADGLLQHNKFASSAVRALLPLAVAVCSS